MVNSIGTLPGPCTGTSSPAARTVRGPATKGTATEIPEILRKSRRETRELSGLSSEIFRFGSSSRIRYLQITENRKLFLPSLLTPAPSELVAEKCYAATAAAKAFMKTSCLTQR